jgi:hypothetical protein
MTLIIPVVNPLAVSPLDSSGRVLTANTATIVTTDSMSSGRVGDFRFSDLVYLLAMAGERPELKEAKAQMVRLFLFHDVLFLWSVLR